MSRDMWVKPHSDKDPWQHWCYMYGKLYINGFLDELRSFDSMYQYAVRVESYREMEE